MAWYFPNDYPDSVNEGDAFRELVTTINPEIQLPQTTDHYQDELDAVLSWVAGQDSHKKPLPYLNGFLSRILVPGGIQSDLIEVWGVDEIVSNQAEWAPICNVGPDVGFIQFASWTGDYSDGDGWCLDLVSSEVVCLPVSCGDEARSETRYNTYARLPNFSYFVAYLSSAALQRGWLNNVVMTPTARDD